jgi:hypothetical protein
MQQSLDTTETQGMLYATEPTEHLGDCCWCGSLKKYKLCHFKRMKNPPFEYNEILKVLKQGRKRTQSCMLAGCNSKTIKSHSIPSSWLCKISDSSNHLYNFQRDIFRNLEDLNNGSSVDNNGFSVENISIHKGSTFQGFCEKHDNDLFDKIEKEKGWKINEENMFYIFYRCLCYELNAKRTVKPISLQIRDIACNGKDPYEQVYIYNTLSEHIEGVTKAIEDLESLKAFCEGCIDAADYSKIQYTYIPLEILPSFMASGLHQPLQTFMGTTLQNMMEDELFNIACTVGVNGEKGFVSFVNIDSSDNRAKIFHQDLLNCKKLGKRLVAYNLESTENLFWSIKNWEQLAAEKQNILTELFGNSILSDINVYSTYKIKIPGNLLSPKKEDIVQFGI